MDTGFFGIQSIVDALASELSRAVLVDDRELNALCWSSQQEVDPIRLSSILRNGLDSAAIDVVNRIGKSNSVVVTEEVPEIGMKSRVCAPLVHEGELIGYLWVLDPQRTVTEAQKLDVRTAANNIVTALATDRNTDDNRRRNELLAKLERGHDDESATSLTIHEQLPRDVHVVADLHKQPGDWVLPDGIAVRPVPKESLGATSGTPLPLADLGDAVRRARLVRTAIRAGAKLDMPRWDALQSWRLVLECPETLTPEDIQPHVNKLLEPAHQDLLKTAEVLFDSGGDIQAATEALHIHRTTFYYRLGKISDLLGVNLQHDSDKQNLDFALKLHRIRSVLHL
ncbi:MAG: hypothetical protein F2839_04280 [Actinobacteria bacterium]|uniref:Unannotated protein n=1 Tax=freshwater metagenome TaxID=449393 RepID=A0A6J5ZHH5_9ZZZZ|nr:hypothetical protein [Actinomycetota bacterium]